MSAFHKAEARIHRGGKNLLYFQILQGQDVSHYINNGIDGSHFVEMNLLHSAAVNLRFRFGNGQKHLFGFGNDIFREFRMIKNLFYIMKVPVFVVVMVFMLMIMLVVMIMAMAARFFMNMFMVMTVGNAVGMHPGMIMLMAVFMLVFVLMVMIMFFRQDYIKIPRLYAAFVHALMNQFIAAQMELGKHFLQISKRNACVQQGAKQHIPADAGKRFYV